MMTHREQQVIEASAFLYRMAPFLAANGVKVDWKAAIAMFESILPKGQEGAAVPCSSPAITFGDLDVAVLAEREACAKLAEAHVPDSASASEPEILQGVASAIRARGA